MRKKRQMQKKRYFWRDRWHLFTDLTISLPAGTKLSQTIWKLLGKCITFALPFRPLLNSTHLLLKAGALFYLHRQQGSANRARCKKDASGVKRFQLMGLGSSAPHQNRAVFLVLCSQSA
jgi:hypothetical protein